MAETNTKISKKEVRASLGDLRISPRKVRLVTDLLNQKSVEVAKMRLRFTTKKAAKPVLKLINSAVANATNNFQLDASKLFIKSIFVNQGTPMVRYKARAQGRVAPIKHRISKVNIILVEKEGLKAKQRQQVAISSEGTAVKEKKKPEVSEHEREHDTKAVDERAGSVKPQVKRPQSGRESRFKKGFVDLKKRFFNRKTNT